MATVTSETAPAVRPRRSPYITVLAAWLVPGAGHFLLGRWARGAMLAFAVIVTFLIGLGMQGPFFKPGQDNGDILSRVIQGGGFVGDIANGGLYFIAAGAGYSGSDSAGHVAEYGSKILVTAGLLNILAMVDAFEIADRQKD